LSGYTIVVKVDTDEQTAIVASRLIKEALAGIGVATFTFDDATFTAHWQPPPRQTEHRNGQVAQPEHSWSQQNGPRRR
jgi:hypothetical protein